MSYTLSACWIALSASTRKNCRGQYLVKAPVAYPALSSYSFATELSKLCLCKALLLLSILPSILSPQISLEIPPAETELPHDEQTERGPQVTDETNKNKLINERLRSTDKAELVGDQLVQSTQPRDCGREDKLEERDVPGPLQATWGVQAREEAEKEELSDARMQQTGETKKFGDQPVHERTKTKTTGRNGIRKSSRSVLSTPYFRVRISNSQHAPHRLGPPRAFHLTPQEHLVQLPQARL